MGAGRPEQYPPIRTITECALYHRNIRLTCRSCGHVRIFHAHALWWLFERRRWDDHLRVIARRFYCQPCWRGRFTKISGPRVEVTRDDPTGDRLPLPEEREWKRVVRRYRS